jgi:hypothetical protein
MPADSGARVSLRLHFSDACSPLSINLPIKLMSLRIIGLAAICASAAIASARADSQLPNILFILTDDQGWSSLGCYGSEHVATPHLDRLAREGMRLTDAYVMPQCTPTRAALLSGEHTARNGMWHVIGWYGYPWCVKAKAPFTKAASVSPASFAGLPP